MNDKQIINEIDDYLSNPLKYALLLNGSWGCGKTHFVKNKLEKYDTIYVSLYGLNSLSNLTFQVLYKLTEGQMLSVENKFIKSISKIIKPFKKKVNAKVANTASSMLVSYIESKINVPIQSIVEMLSNVDLKNKLIILDDLERSVISIDEVLGFINTMVEHNSIKVLLVANEDEISDKDDYLKTKEKLIYQTIQYKPDLNSIFLEVIKEDNKTILNNKDFLIKELVDEGHNNIRTLQFIIQRYKELEKKLEKIFDSIKNEKIVQQIKNEIFKYFVIVARTYKSGEKLPIFENEADISSCELEKGSLQKIVGFKFVNDFIIGVPMNLPHVESVLITYSSQLILENSKDDIPLDILDKWWEEDDEVVRKKTNRLLDVLKSGLLGTDLYIKILIYLANIQNCGFEDDFLEKGFMYMKSNIESSSNVISLDVKFENWIDEEAKPMYMEKRKELELIIKNHNDKVNDNDFLNCFKKEPGEIGKSLYDCCMSKRDIIIENGGLLNIIKNENIINTLKEGSPVDIRFLIYLFYDLNKSVSYVITEVEEIDLFEKLINDINSINVDDFSVMKKYNFSRFQKCLSEVTECIKERKS